MKKILLSLFALAIAALSMPAHATDDQKFPDVLQVSIKARSADRFDFDVTMSSPYDTPQRYADAFRIVGPSGEIYGERILVHDHADEQPFTRELYNVAIPAGVKIVTIQGRDQKSGYGGKTQQATLPGR